MFSTESKSLVPLHDINAYWFFDGVPEGTSFPKVDILRENSEILERLNQNRWITDPRIDKSVVLTMDYIFTVMKEETDERVRDGLISLGHFYLDEDSAFIPDLTKLDEDIVNLIISNKYIINNSVKAEAIKFLREKIKADITSMKERFAKILQPIFNQYCDNCKDGTFTFREHQMYALLWFLDNMLDKDKDINNAIRELLIFHKTRSGKSVTIASIIILMYHFSKEQQYNVFYTGFYPDIFHAVSDSAFKNDLKCNIPLNKMDIRKDDIILQPTGINLALCSFQYLYKRKNEMQTKKRLKQAHAISWHLMVIDEAHDAREAELTATELKKISYGMQINMTATPNKKELLDMDHIEFTYREEQLLKKLGYDKYKTAPKRLSVDLSKYSDVLSDIKNRDPNYNDISDFFFHFDGGNNKSEPKSHNDSDTIQSILRGLVHGINMSQFNGAKDWSPKTARRIYKNVRLSFRNFLKLTNNEFFHNNWLDNKMIDLDALTSNDIKKCMDSIIVMGNTKAVDTLYKVMQEDSNISRLFEVVRSHYRTDDKMTTRQLEELTSERSENDKPRILILCSQGLHGSTFKSINATIFLASINSDARYKQAGERGGTYVVGKNEYFIMDFDPLNLVDFEPHAAKLFVNENEHLPPKSKVSVSFIYDGAAKLTDNETKWWKMTKAWENSYDLRQHHLPVALKKQRNAARTKMANLTYEEGMKLLLARIK